MISKIDMSIWTSVSAPCGTVSSTLLTRVPTVWRYVSWYSLRTKRRISEVFPTPPSPMRASFAFMRRTVGIGIGRAPHPEPGYKQFRRVDRRTPVTERRYRPGPVHDRSADKCSSPADDFDRLQSFDRARTALNYHVRVGGVLRAENWNQHEHRCIYPTRGSRHRHAISPRRATDSRPELAHRMVEVPRRSEEHTSELQSQSNLVCRLLLEKKKKHIAPSGSPHCGNARHPHGRIFCSPARFTLEYAGLPVLDAGQH